MPATHAVTIYEYVAGLALTPRRGCRGVELEDCFIDALDAGVAGVAAFAVEGTGLARSV
jgi:hypothetical protein